MKRIIPLFLAVFFVTGCSYHFAGQGSSLPESIKSISIPIFESDVQQPNLDITVTRAVTEKFIRDGRLKVVDGGADCLLTGTVKSYALEPVAFDSLNRVSQYRIKMMVKIQFTDNVGKGIALNRDLKVQWDYNLGAAIPAAETARNLANREVADYLGDRLVGLILEGF